MSERIISAPPNLRSVPACENCKHAEHGYEGHIACGRFGTRPDWMDQDDDPMPYEIGHNSICDDHETNAPETRIVEVKPEPYGWCSERRFEGPKSAPAYYFLLDDRAYESSTVSVGLDAIRSIAAEHAPADAHIFLQRDDGQPDLLLTEADAVDLSGWVESKQRFYTAPKCAGPWLRSRAPAEREGGGA